MTRQLASAFAFAWLICALGLLALLQSRLAHRWLDRTDKRHAMHAVAVPRLGGLVLITAGALSVLLVGGIDHATTLMLTIGWVALLLACASFMDDIRGLSPAVRLVMHLAAAATVTSASGLGLDRASSVTGVWALTYAGFAILAILAIAWMTNLYNFMDGANGLAGFMGIIGFGTMSWVAGQHSQWSLALICAAVSGACFGFLVFNFPRARIFMGDGGSIPLGFLAASLGLYGYQHGVWTWAFPLLVFSPFVVDATVTLAKRIAAGARIWEAHRQHYYHRLILDCGWSHTRTALVYAALMVATSGYSLMLLPTRLGDGENAREIGDVLLYLAPWAVIYASLIAALEWRLRSARLRKNRA
jgi:UDP-N-acetylmuramyl pentapeptide phosphotransferase/UDP-N-acetylglucosamine-1-phosphate transferase